MRGAENLEWGLFTIIQLHPLAEPAGRLMLKQN